MSETEPDPSRCPLCGGPNGCALALPPESRPAECWCVTKRFPRDLTDRAAQPTCICGRCVAAHTEDG